jgi:hypothetical protein
MTHLIGSDITHVLTGLKLLSGQWSAMERTSARLRLAIENSRADLSIVKIVGARIISYKKEFLTKVSHGDFIYNTIWSAMERMLQYAIESAIEIVLLLSKTFRYGDELDKNCKPWRGVLTRLKSAMETY